MTESTHTYSAVLLGTTNRTLSVRGGTITLDERSSPHVTASLEIAIPSATILAELDPRAAKRVRVTATSVSTRGTQTRTFDLALRGREVNHRGATVSVDLASDEALLIDYAPLADDKTPYTLASSLRAVINYVLSKATPGVSLQTSPNNDADVRAYWRLTNLARNAATRSNANGYSPGTGTESIGRHTDITDGPLPTIRFSAAGTGEAYLNTPTTGVPVSPGRKYSAAYRILQSTANQRPARVFLRFKDANGNNVGVAYGPTVTPTGGWARPSLVGVTAPPNAASVEMFANTVTNAPGQAHYATAFTLVEGDILPPEFWDGATTLDGYNVFWDNTEDTTTSTATRVPNPVTREPDSLIWKAGQPALDFLMPLVQASGLRLVADETRKFTLRSETYTAPGVLAVRHGVNLIEGSDTIRRDDEEWFDAAVTIYTWTDATGATQVAYDAFALQTPYTRLRTFERATPYPGPGLSAYAVRRAQGRGREVSATIVADWTGSAEQPVSILLEGAPIQVGQTGRVTFDLNSDEMSLTSRTTDTPVGSIDLLNGTIDQLAGTINQL